MGCDLLTRVTSGQFEFLFECELMLHWIAGKKLQGYCVLCQLAQQPSPLLSVTLAGKVEPREVQTSNIRSDWKYILQWMRA